MATNHCNTSTGKAATRQGGRHCSYIFGEDKYSDKNEVIFKAQGNIPCFAKNAKDFFEQVDENERSNGRSYRGLVVAIPTEAQDPVLWSKAFVRDVVGDKAFAMAVHANEGNPHLHLMFSERKNDAAARQLDAKKYNSRANPKDAKFKKKDWLEGVKVDYEKHVLKVAPSYKFKRGHRKGTKQLKAWQTRAIADAKLVQALPRLLEEQAQIERELEQAREQTAEKKSEAAPAEEKKAQILEQKKKPKPALERAKANAAANTAAFAAKQAATTATVQAVKERGLAFAANTSIGKAPPPQRPSQNPNGNTAAKIQREVESSLRAGDAARAEEAATFKEGQALARRPVLIR